MGHLNAFVPYADKPLHHEDQLTRAFLILLRYSKLVEQMFVDLLRERMKDSGIEVLPSSLHVGLGGLESVETQVWSSTKQRLEAESGRLVSVVITDELLQPDHRVTRSERLAVYDGFLRLKPNWVIVIENKPDHRNIWPEQLSSAFSEEFVVEETPVVITWSEIITRLGFLVTNELVHDAARGLVEDFLTFTAIHFPELSPYDSFRLCNDQYHLLQKRCVSIMSDTSLGPVEYHRGWHYSIRLADKPGAKELSLHPDTDSVNAWPIHLDMHPGDTMGQARALYRTIDPAALLGLVENGWSVAPNFHIAFMSSNLYWGQTDLPLEEYVEYWKNQVATEGLAQVPREQWEGYFGTLLSQRIISGRDVDGINELVTPTAMSTLNICPGISIRYSWAREDAIKLDDGDLFLNEFLKRVNDVLNVW